jgi:hypothetical protein
MHHFIRHISVVVSIVLVAVLQRLSAQSVFINEYMASNAVTIKDPDYNNYADWIELYNAGETAVNLKGYSITDNLSQPKKFVFTADIVILPHSFVIIWADDAAVGVHTNFKLSAAGESIGLYDPAGSLVDTVTFGPQPNDISKGRYPDGASSWYAMSPATPGTANLESSIVEKLSQPLFSHAAGFYPAAVSVTLSHPIPGVTLRYTRDGHTPTQNSTLYLTPIAVDSTQAIRVRAFKDGMLPSRIATSTYFIDIQSDLPVFSLTTDPENFFSDTAGIYVIGTNGIIGNCSTAPRNWNQEWERPVDLEFFEKDKHLAFNVSTGVQIYGGCTRLYPQKSLAFYFRGEYGFGKLKYGLFPDQTITEYNNFVLRSSGQDWWRTMFREGMAHILFKTGMKIDYVDYRPSVLFINGQYWGIHNIREKLNEHYVESHHNINGDNIDLIEISKEVGANNGDVTAYNAMISYLTANSLAVQSNFDYISSMIDLDEYIDYQIAQIYAANGDWPGSNMKLWRERKPGSKWRWMIYDLDFTFGGNAQGQYFTNTLAQATATNGPAWPNPPWSTLMLRRMLENTGFRNEFIQRYAAHLNTTFEKSHVHAVIDSLALGIASEIPRHKSRWPQSMSLDKNNWAGNIQIMKDFATYRPDTSMKHFRDKFSLPGINRLNISRNIPDAGRIYTNSVEVKKNGSNNTFFRGVPLRIRAEALPGFRFVQWEGVTTTAAPETSIMLTVNSTLTAVFEPAAVTATDPVINEINYKSSPLFDTEDWVELYNPSPDPINLNGWSIGQGSAGDFIFPPGSTIPGRGYAVLCRDTVKFKALRPAANNVYGNMEFGFSSSGERIQLYTPSKAIVDDVHYLPAAPWVTAPNGNGPTLSLINPGADNHLAENWKASKQYGTPGALNDVYIVLSVHSAQQPGDYELYQNFPNPFNPSTVIAFRLRERTTMTLTVYNQLGQIIRRIIDEPMDSGHHEITFHGDGIASGIYFYEMTAPRYKSVKKLLLLK